MALISMAKLSPKLIDFAGLFPCPLSIKSAIGEHYLSKKSVLDHQSVLKVYQKTVNVVN